MNDSIDKNESKKIQTAVTWKYIVVTIFATIISTLLAIFAVIAAPVAPFPGVSGLYLAAAIYVPLSLWLGGWGVLAGYFSCVILGFVQGFGAWSFYWALADLFEGLLPLFIFRLTQTDVDIGKDLSKPKETYLLLGGLLINLIIAAIATVFVLSLLWLITFLIAVGLLIVLYILNPSKPMLLYIVFGVFGASLISALFGISGIILAGFGSLETFATGVLGWFAGDVIVLSAIATPLMILLTKKIKQTSIFVENWFV
ncbi:MAG: conserved membrane protein of unknown function [Promethearchaeota archaeon]|nr:MAG: conserved membrane protein of unknown function [Candidatus Lokiarchaeota archaeon]